MNARNIFLRVCQCCLSSEPSALSSINDSEQFLQFLVGQKMKMSQKYLCYKCRHILRKFSNFRNMCLKSNTLLTNYHKKNSKNLAKKCSFKENVNQCNELSLSNTLCINVNMDTKQSSVNIVSFNRGPEPISNFSENITEFHDTKIEPDIKMESDSNQELAAKTFEFIDNFNLEHRLTQASDFSDDLDDNYLDEIEPPEEKFKPSYDLQIIKGDNIELPIENKLEFQISDINKHEESSSVLDNSFFENENLKYEAISSLCERKLSLRLDPKRSKSKKSRSILEKKINFSKSSKVKTPKEILDEVDKACAIPLTHEQQIKKLQDKAKESSYIDANYRCELCVLPFYTRLAIENHMKKHDESSGPYVCPICTQRFLEKEKLSFHRITHSLNLVCKLCDKQFPNKRSYRNHLVWHSTGNITCSVCRKDFKTTKNLASHMKSKHGPDGAEKHKCQICGKEFNKKSFYNEHILRHTGVPTHTCSICSKGFYSLKSLSLHQDVHKSITTNYYCVECDRRFKSSTAWYYHLKQSKSHRDPTSVNYKCPQCPLSFATANLRTQHVNAQHEGVSYYICESCGARYLTRTGLIRHIKTKHEGFKAPRKFPCTLCENAFASKVILENHIRVHTGERPFQCQQCRDTFTQKAALRTHIKLVHLKIKLNNKHKVPPEGIGIQ